MAYSRWLGSNWYVYWAGGSAVTINDEQKLACWYAGDSKFPTLTESQIAQALQTNTWDFWDEPLSERDLAELKLYISDWHKDLADERSDKTNPDSDH